MKLELGEDQGVVEIAWSDGLRTTHSMNQLRKDCPCANCRVERQKLEAPGPVLRVISSEAPAVAQAKVVEFSPVGRYALSFLFNDGHSTGIYTYEFLRETALDDGPLGTTEK